METLIGMGEWSRGSWMQKPNWNSAFRKCRKQHCHFTEKDQKKPERPEECSSLSPAPAAFCVFYTFPCGCFWCLNIGEAVRFSLYAVFHEEILLLGKGQASWKIKVQDIRGDVFQEGIFLILQKRYLFPDSVCAEVVIDTDLLFQKSCLVSPLEQWC